MQETRLAPLIPIRVISDHVETGRAALGEEHSVVVHPAVVAAFQGAVVFQAEGDPVGVGKLNHQKIVDTICHAEAGTSGEIRIHLSNEKIKKDILVLAQEQFQKLNMHQTQLRNGVLLYINLAEKQFSLFGDEGIHQKVTQTFWNQLVTDVSTEIKSHSLETGIIYAIQKIGAALKNHFPSDPTLNPNELTNEVSTDH